MPVRNRTSCHACRSDRETKQTRPTTDRLPPQLQAPILQSSGKSSPGGSLQPRPASASSSRRDKRRRPRCPGSSSRLTSSRNPFKFRMYAVCADRSDSLNARTSSKGTESRSSETGSRSKATTCPAEGIGSRERVDMRSPIARRSFVAGCIARPGRSPAARASWPRTVRIVVRTIGWSRNRHPVLTSSSKTLCPRVRRPTSSTTPRRTRIPFGSGITRQSGHPVAAGRSSNTPETSNSTITEARSSVRA